MRSSIFDVAKYHIQKVAKGHQKIGDFSNLI